MGGTVLSDPKTPEDHANEKKHEPLVVPCDCNAKDIHPSCGCPGNEGMGDLGMNGSSATGGVEMKTVTTVQNTPCGCCGVETCKCCAKKVEYQKPKMVQSLTVKLSDCACVGLPSCACNTKMPVDIETATAPRKNSVDEKTLEKLEDIAVGRKEDAEKAVEEKRSEKKEKPVEEVNKPKGKNVDKKENTKETETMPKKDLKKELEEMEKKILGNQAQETKVEKQANAEKKAKEPEAEKATEPKVEKEDAATGEGAEVTKLVKQMDGLDVQKIQLREKLTKRLATLTLRRAALVKRRSEIDAKLAKIPE